MERYVIIGDVHGHYETLQRLLDRVDPKRNFVPVSCGDMVDRGPDSAKVVEFFRTTGLAVKGNHEAMMVDYYQRTNIYEDGLWRVNGGAQTGLSYHKEMDTIDKDLHVQWMHALPMKLEIEGTPLWITHSGHADDFWTTERPGYTPDALKLYGHVGKPGPEILFKKRGDGKKIPYAVGLDTHPINCLTCLVWPDMYFVSEYHR